jgi:tetratricopeptide (TPR) repeat protein
LRVVAAAVIVLLVGALGIVQLASYSLDSAAASPGTLPTRIPVSLGLHVYRALDRIAPATYVESSLANHALATGDLDAAEHYALRLPASPTRDELLARIAQGRGQATLALEYDLAAADVESVQRAVETLASRDPVGAYVLESHLKDRLALLTTHPDAVAESYWMMGELANAAAERAAAGTARSAWLERAVDDFEAAVALAPLSVKYVLSDANAAIALGRLARARERFAQGVDIDPASADSIAGLGVVALRRGDRSAARTYLLRARSLDARSGMVGELERELGRNSR